ncbi:MAG: hypothetical protein ABJK28_09280 [Algibacter sp.]
MGKSKKVKTSFFQNNWVKFTGLVLTVGTLIGFGVAIGIFKGEIDCKVERMEIIEEYQEKLSGHDELCKQTNIDKIESDISDIQEIVNLLQNRGTDEK